MNPWRTDLQTFLAAECAWNHVANDAGMAAFFGHQCLPVLVGSVALSPASVRKPCSAATTCAPSPTAAATRLIDPERTSPIANTPGRLVSSSLWRLAPVPTKPLSSSSIPDADNHPVFRSAPINKNRCRIARFSSSPDRRERHLFLFIG